MWAEWQHIMQYVDKHGINMSFIEDPLHMAMKTKWDLHLTWACGRDHRL
jgi:hypothetical protein